MSLLGTAFFNQIASALRLHTSELARLNEQIASGKRLSRISDDPAAGSRLLSLNAETRIARNRLSNIAELRSNLSLAAGTLQDVSGAITSAQTLVSQALGPAFTDANRAIVAEEINALLEHVLALANTQRLGARLFAGKNTHQAPYEAEWEDGRIVSVRYTGTDRANSLSLGDDILYPLTFNGREIFSIDGRAAPLFTGDTGARAGSGSSSVAGDLWLDVTHTSTACAGASGAAPGDSSATGDTILGAHSLTIDDVASTIQLDGGAVVSYGGTETDLRLTNEDGDVAYVDVTGITSGFQGQIALQSDGALSIDGGASSVAVDWSPNQVVTDLATGAALFVDTSSVARTGRDAIHVQGARDLFATLIHLRDTMAGAGDLDDATRTELLGQGLVALNDLSRGLVNSLASVGARLSALESVEEAFENLFAAASADRSRIEDADIISVVAELAQRETLYQMTLAAVARIANLSLLDFLR